MKPEFSRCVSLIYLPHALGICLLLILAGCETTGEVHVGNPEVFTRARLVDARLTETQWLTTQLNKTYQPTFQGLADQRIIQTFSESLTANLSSAGGKSSGAAAAAKTSSGSTGANPSSGAGNSIAGAPPAAGGAAASTSNSGSASGGAGSNSSGSAAGDSNGSGTKTSAGGSTTGEGSPSLPNPTPNQTAAQNSMIDQLHDQLAYRNEVNANMREQQLDDTHDLRGYTLYSMKFDTSILPGDSSHRFAYIRLDVKPMEPILTTQRTNDNFARANLNYITYRQWLAELDSELQQETRRAEGLIIRNQLSDPYLVQLERDLVHTEAESKGAAPGSAGAQGGGASTPGTKNSGKDAPISEGAGRNAPSSQENGGANTATADSLNDSIGVYRDALAKYILSNRSGRLTLFDSTKHPELIAEANLIKEAIATAIRNRFELSTKGFANVSKVNHTTIAGQQSFYVSTIDFPPIPGDAPLLDYGFEESRTNSGYNALKRYLAALDLKPKVLSVTPAENAQNISDVSSRQDSMDLMLALNAAYGPINVGDTTKYFKETEALLNAIRRQPLAIGTHNGASEFGLIIGPKFRIVEGKPEFLHTPARYTFNVDIAVPAWWDRVRFTANYYWCREDGTLDPAAGTNAWDANCGVESDSNAYKDKTLVVHLPSDVSALTAALDFRTNATRRLPKIDPREATPAYYLRASVIAGDLTPSIGASANSTAAAVTGGVSKSQNSDQTILIQGTDLWRNPKVFVGSQQASQVDVLPDMNGLLAHFSAVSYPVTDSDAAPPQDLTVVTSFGYDVVKGAVKILPPAKATPVTGLTAFATFNGHFAIAATANNVVFVLNSNSAPVTGLTSVELYLKRHGDPYKMWTLISDATPQFASAQISYSLPGDFQTKYPNLTPHPWQGKSPTAAAYDIDLRLVANPNEAAKSVLAGGGGTFVYFASEKDRELQFTSLDAKNAFTLTGDPKKPLSFSAHFEDTFDPSLLEIAYPGWTKASDAVFTEGGRSASGTAAVTSGAVNITIAVDKLQLAPNGSSYKVTVGSSDNALFVPIFGSLTVTPPPSVTGAKSETTTPPAKN